MKPLSLLSLFVLLAPALQAQTPTFAEIFKQKKTQKKYFYEQIAELQLYIGHLQKGYDIAREGLQTIRSIKNGEWDLHRVFFGSLKIVSPRIRNYAKVAAIIDNQRLILKTFRNGLKDAQDSRLLSADELSYCYEVFDRVLKDTERNIAMLLLVLSDGQLEMSDDERIASIDRLYEQSEQNRVFTSHFASNILLQAIGKAHELDDNSTLRTLYDLKK